jgi:hypothetical protein
MPEGQRPPGVSILGILAIIGGLLGLLLAIPFLVVYYQPAFSGYLIFFGMLMVITGTGFLLCWRGAWYLALILVVVGIFFDLALIYYGRYSNVAVLIIHIIILVYLTLRTVRSYFGT